MPKCPASNIEYKGKCKVFTCPANLRRLTGKKGCYFEKGGSRLLEISSALKMNTKEVNANYALGLKELTNFSNAYNQMKNCKMATCPNCGFVNETCKKKKWCKSRRLYIHKIMERYPFNISDFDWTPAQIYKLAYLTVEGKVTNYFPKSFIQFVTRQLKKSKIGKENGS